MSIDTVGRCNEPECINDALMRLHKELRGDERVWMVEQNSDGEWSCSVVEDSFVPERTFYNRGYGRGNNMYQAITACRLNLIQNHLGNR